MLASSCTHVFSRGPNDRFMVLTPPPTLPPVRPRPKPYPCLTPGSTRIPNTLLVPSTPYPYPHFTRIRNRRGKHPFHFHHEFPTLELPLRARLIHHRHGCSAWEPVRRNRMSIAPQFTRAAYIIPLQLRLQGGMDIFDVFLAGFPPSTNSTCSTFTDGENICLPPLKVPIYFIMRQNLLDGVSDNNLALAAPVVAYWSMSLFFHFLDKSGWIWLDKYRIHDSDEIKSRNRATLSQVVHAVVVQQTLQTALGYYWLSDLPEISPSKCVAEMVAIGKTLVYLVTWVVGPDAGNCFLDRRGADITHWLYWWGIPAIQLFFSLFIVDTWQYFLHRWMHSNKFLYKHIHSVHHRLYVPYAFGALYNHPLEGFLLDSVGALVAQTVPNLSVRQTMFLFAFSTIKAVDDHCGYRFPLDPLQMCSYNNADYHDIHHQTIGIKSNFSQPFFVHWDAILGSRMTREDLEVHKQKLKTT